MKQKEIKKGLIKMIKNMHIEEVELSNPLKNAVINYKGEGGYEPTDIIILRIQGKRSNK